MSEAVASNVTGAAEWTRPVLLRQARESAGLHIAALAAALKVPVRKLEALEAGQYHELPDMTFARALASSACRHLKVDPAPVLEQIPLGHAPVLGDTASTINTPFRSPKASPSVFLVADWVRRPAVLMAGALVLAAVGLFYMPDWRPMVSSVSDAVSSLASSPSVPSSDTPAAPAVVRSPQQTVSTTVDTPTPSAPALPVGAADSAPAVAPSAAAPPTASAADGLLNIKATGDSWVEVVDGAGVSQVQRMLKTGDVLSFSVAPPYSVVLGRADAVVVSVRGQPFDVMPYARNSVARFQVK